MDTQEICNIPQWAGFNEGKFLSVGCSNKSSVNTLPVTGWEIVTKGKLQGVREHLKYWVMSDIFKETILCCFPLVLKLSKPNSNDETYYFSQASTLKSHLSSLWPNVTARVVWIFCHQVCWKRLMQPHPRKQRSVYLETAKWLAESPACLCLSDRDLCDVWVQWLSQWFKASL